MSTNERIKSPCIGNCCLNTDDVCLGCHRHVDEITGWNGYDNTDRVLVLKLAELRKQSYTKLLLEKQSVDSYREARLDR